MEIIIFVLFIVSAVALFLATTNFFENITKETLTEPAEIISARENIQQNGCGCSGAPLETRDYHITFMLPSNGNKLKCRVPEKMLKEFKVGMTGQLTHKGTWFKCFADESQGVTIGKQCR